MLWVFFWKNVVVTQTKFHHLVGHEVSEVEAPEIFDASTISPCEETTDVARKIQRVGIDTGKLSCFLSLQSPHVCIQASNHWIFDDLCFLVVNMDVSKHVMAWYFYVVPWFHHFLVKAFPRPFKNLSMCVKCCTDDTWQKGHLKNNHTDTLNDFGVFMLSQMQQLLVFCATYISGLTGRDATERPRGNLSAMAQRTHLTTEDEKRRSIRHIHERSGVSAKRQWFVHAVDGQNPAVIDTDISEKLH